MNEPSVSYGVDLLPQAVHLHIDDVVEWRRAPWLFPHFTRQHLARDEMALMTQQVFKQLKLAGRQLEEPFATYRPSRHQVQLEVRGLQTKDFGRTTAAQQRPNSSEELRQREGLDQVVIGAQIQAQDTVIHTV